MSEYQYFEFQAIDRPLTDREMGTLRAYSTRATITPTRFVNHYEWGDFKGDPLEWMERYFDAFLYLASWGTRELMLRLPRRALAAAKARRYVRGESASARVKGDHVILHFHSESDDGDWDDDGSGWLASLIPLRVDLVSGDDRALYLAWLLAGQSGEVDGATPEPPVPAGLGRLSAPLVAFADFLHIDEDLIAAAAERRGDSDESPASKEALVRFVSATLKPSAYDEAVLLLRDLRDVAAAAGRAAETRRRIERLRDEHARKPSFVARLRRARLVEGSGR